MLRPSLRRLRAAAGAPASIQACSIAICFSVSGSPSGGIFRSPCRSTAAISRLSPLLPGDNDRAAIAPLQNRRHAIQPQVAFLLERAVAAKAPLGQDRLDIAKEINWLFSLAQTWAQTEHVKNGNGNRNITEHKNTRWQKINHPSLIVAAACGWLQAFRPAIIGVAREDDAVATV